MRIYLKINVNISTYACETVCNESMLPWNYHDEVCDTIVTSFRISPRASWLITLTRFPAFRALRQLPHQSPLIALASSPCPFHPRPRLSVLGGRLSQFAIFCAFCWDNRPRRVTTYVKCKQLHRPNRILYGLYLWADQASAELVCLLTEQRTCRNKADCFLLQLWKVYLKTSLFFENFGCRQCFKLKECTKSFECISAVYSDIFYEETEWLCLRTEPRTGWRKADCFLLQFCKVLMETQSFFS